MVKQERQAEMLSLLQAAVDDRWTLGDRAHGYGDGRICQWDKPHRPGPKHANGRHCDDAEPFLDGDVASR